MAAGIQIVCRDNTGQIKQDYSAYRDDRKGKVVEIDRLKAIEAKSIA
jgi:hypothetical protein